MPANHLLASIYLLNRPKSCQFVPIYEFALKFSSIASSVHHFKQASNSTFLPIHIWNPNLKSQGEKTIIINQIAGKLPVRSTWRRGRRRCPRGGGDGRWRTSPARYPARTHPTPDPPPPAWASKAIQTPGYASPGRRRPNSRVGKRRRPWRGRGAAGARRWTGRYPAKPTQRSWSSSATAQRGRGCRHRPVTACRRLSVVGRGVVGGDHRLRRSSSPLGDGRMTLSTPSWYPQIEVIIMIITLSDVTNLDFG